MKRIFNIVATLLIVVVLIFAVGRKNIMYFVDVPSLALVIGITHFVIISSVGLSGLRTVISWIFGKEVNYREIRKIGQLGCLGSIGSGAIGSILGMILMLQNLSDPSALGVGMAVSALPGLYGMLLALVVFVPLCFASDQGDGDNSSAVNIVSGIGFIAIPAFLMGETFLFLDLAMR